MNEIVQHTRPRAIVVVSLFLTIPASRPYFMRGRQSVIIQLAYLALMPPSFHFPSGGPPIYLPTIRLLNDLYILVLCCAVHRE